MSTPIHISTHLPPVTGFPQATQETPSVPLEIDASTPEEKKISCLKRKLEGKDEWIRGQERTIQTLNGLIKKREAEIKQQAKACQDMTEVVTKLESKVALAERKVVEARSKEAQDLPVPALAAQNDDTTTGWGYFLRFGSCCKRNGLLCDAVIGFTGVALMVAFAPCTIPIAIGTSATIALVRWTVSWFD